MRSPTSEKSIEGNARRGIQPRTTIVLLTIVLGVAGCTTARETNPKRTATEQLLISTAVDHAADQLNLGLPKGMKVFLDTQYFEGTDQKYAISAIRDRLLKQGARLVADKGNADAVVEIRAGALSVDEDTTLFGIPSFDIPIPLSGPLKFPEIALYKKYRRIGVAKFAMTGYDAKQGNIKASSGPDYGYSHRTKWTVLVFISWTKDDLIPESQSPENRLEEQERKDQEQEDGKEK